MADVEARVTERLGEAKLRRLQALLAELDAALDHTSQTAA